MKYCLKLKNYRFIINLTQDIMESRPILRTKLGVQIFLNSVEKDILDGWYPNFGYREIRGGEVFLAEYAKGDYILGYIEVV